MSPTASVGTLGSCAAHRRRVAHDGAQTARVLGQQPLGLLAATPRRAITIAVLTLSAGRVEHRARIRREPRPVVSIRMRWLRSTSLSFQARRSTIRLP